MSKELKITKDKLLKKRELEKKIIDTNGKYYYETVRHDPALLEILNPEGFRTHQLIIPNCIYKYLIQRANWRNTSVNNFLLEIIEEYLEKHRATTCLDFNSETHEILHDIYVSLEDKRKNCLDDDELTKEHIADTGKKVNLS